jgi:hypothetical protein
MQTEAPELLNIFYGAFIQAVSYDHYSITVIRIVLTYSVLN